MQMTTIKQGTAWLNTAVAQTCALQTVLTQPGPDADNRHRVSKTPAACVSVEPLVSSHATPQATRKREAPVLYETAVKVKNMSAAPWSRLLDSFVFSLLLIFHRLIVVSLSVVLKSNKGDYPENSHDVFCPNK